MLPARLFPTARTVLPLALLLAACGGPLEEDPVEDFTPTGNTNPFLAIENEQEKADTAYVNPSGKEIEVDLEADIVTTGDVRKGPAELGQFALTYLRKQGDFYLESLAEHAGSADRVEWKIGTTWKTATEVRSMLSSQLKHFRIRGVNAIVLGETAKAAKKGKVYTAPVPKDPFGLYSAIQNACAEEGGHIGADNNVYWYVWEPNKPSCDASRKQTMNITVSALLPKGQTVYPEFDKLTADKKVTAVILFGQIGDGAITDQDSGVRGFNSVANLLIGGKYKEIKPAPVGRRFSKTFNGIEMQVDLYSPYDFSGLGDYAHFNNLQKAITEHEIVAYDGHSMLGASDFWSRPTYPRNYQIFLYGGCLGYEYYVRPIVEGKGGNWDNLDLMSSVVEVSADAERFAVPVIAKLTYAMTHGYKVSWQNILSSVRTSVGDSTFGVSGVRENKYCPPGVTTCAK